MRPSEAELLSVLAVWMTTHEIGSDLLLFGLAWQPAQRSGPSGSAPFWTRTLDQVGHLYSSIARKQIYVF